MASKKTVTKKEGSFTSKEFALAKTALENVLVKNQRGMVIIASETKDGDNLQVLGGRRQFGLDATMQVICSAMNMNPSELAIALVMGDSTPEPTTPKKSAKKAVKKVAKKVAKKVTKK